MASTSNPRKPSTKAEQRAETMEQIFDAAEEQFSIHGLHGVTLKDVAKQVGVHHTLLNYYFDDKRALFDAVFARRASVTSQRRMKAIDDYEASAGGKPTIEGALHAFLDTDLDTYIQAAKAGAITASSARRPRTPPKGAALFDEHFDPVVLRLIDTAQEGATRLLGRGHLLGLSFRHRAPDADPCAHRADRQAVGRRLQVRRLRGDQGAHGRVHGGRFPRGLRRALVRIICTMSGNGTAARTT